MDYWAALTVPANTPASDPTRVTLEAVPGTVKQVWLFFPQGHAGSTKCRILRNEHQVWPTNPGGWYLGDGTAIEFGENYEVVGTPYDFHLEGYNDSTLNAHTVYVRLTILQEVSIPLPTRQQTVEMF